MALRITIKMVVAFFGTLCLSFQLFVMTLQHSALPSVATDSIASLTRTTNQELQYINLLKSTQEDMQKKFIQLAQQVGKQQQQIDALKEELKKVSSPNPNHPSQVTQLPYLKHPNEAGRIQKLITGNRNTHPTSHNAPHDTSAPKARRTSTGTTTYAGYTKHQAPPGSNDPHYKNGVLAFLHIGKAGGTSFSTVGAAIARQAHYQFRGSKHYDWTKILNLKGDYGESKVSVVTLLREPVSRMISHFQYWQTMPWISTQKMYNQTLHDYILGGDQQSLLDTRDIWQDGQAGVSWLTGTHIGDWVVPKITPTMVEERERQSLNYTAMLPLAAARLRETKWFGLLEDLDRSVELLQREFHLDKRPVLLHRNEIRKKTKPPISQEERAALESLMPQDMWLYDYAKRLFEARWQAYKTGTGVVEPEEPPIPHFLPCTSTRFAIKCRSGPLANLFPVEQQ